MTNKFEATWESYTSSWQSKTSDGKRVIFESCLDEECVYNDPLVKTQGWDALVEYMLDFHKQIPDGYFETFYFLAHNNQSIARWYMKNADNDVIGEGISYGEYNNEGKLKQMIGFFDTP